MKPREWMDELKQHQDEIDAGSGPIIERRFIVQEDLEEDRKALWEMMWFCQIRRDLDNLNVSGLVVVWGVLADMLSGKYARA